MARFSERIGKRAPKEIIQVDSMDDDLRNGLWSVVDYFLATPIRQSTSGALRSSIYSLSSTEFYSFLYDMWFSFLKLPTDRMPLDGGKFHQHLRTLFFEWSTFDIYDFLDFAASHKDLTIDREGFIKALNFVLKRDLSAYRFVGDTLRPITDSNQVDAITSAIANTVDNYKGASIHLSTALALLSDRRQPDYRNSIKESISAVESICQAITGDAKATLGPALKKLEQQTPLHGALKEGLLKLYGWTSDSNGIRHALQDEPSLGQEDALFMLVTCSAFVNYLTVKADKAGMTNQTAS